MHAREKFRDALNSMLVSNDPLKMKVRDAYGFAIGVLRDEEIPQDLLPEYKKLIERLQNVEDYDPSETCELLLSFYTDLCRTES